MAETQYFMLPGPTQVPPRVLRAASMPMINHRGPEFKAVFTEVTALLKKVFNTENDLFIFTASGSGGMEASVSNFINPGERVLVASMGNFGSRYRDVCRKMGAEVDFVEFPWGTPVDARVIAQKLAEDKNREIKAVFCQHNETSTGVYNDLQAISLARGDHPALLIVDAVSSVGALPIKTDEWGLDVVVSASQKGLMCPPGLAYMTVNERAWQAAEKCVNACYYFSIKLAKEFLANSQTPFTPGVSTLFAQREALRMIFEQGLDEYIADHFFRRRLVRAGIEAMGLTYLAGEEWASPAVTAVHVPQGFKPSDIVAPLREKFNIVLAGGMGKLKESTFRIGHVGYMNVMDIVVALAGVELALRRLGHPVVLGSGVAAAQELLAQGF
ncbi:MAG: alanine--glyoxylate aminotransferase family protein [Clostridiales bacterium]|nr:alanine--glyoxylate aminotransferase family protein [Clostridiales bacterium]